MNIKDVIVIGSGAAGSTAAYHLANAGHRVALVEKNSERLIKPCGGGMASSVQEWFPFSLEPVVDEVINKVEFTWCLEDKVQAHLPGSSPFWIVRRENLDELITQQAIAKGTEFFTSFSVESIIKEKDHWIVSDINNKQLKSKSIVIADGSNSPWPQHFKLGPKRQHHAFTTSIRINRRGNLEKGSSRFEFGLVRNGFAWAFPLKNGVNIGIGTFIGKNSFDNKKILQNFLPDIGLDPSQGESTQSLLRVWNGHSSLNKSSLIIIGDAASLCDPFLAEGLRPALLSGYEAAKSISDWLNGETSTLDSYTENMREKWGNSMAWGRRISQVFYRFPKVGYQLGIKRPTAPQRIAQILSGEMGYGDIASRVIRRLLLKNN